MLELRPSCEHCNMALPPHATQAMICTFECTFCRACVEDVLGNVCPNCGGGFCARPVRPSTHWKNENYLGKHPASVTVEHRPVDVDKHRQFSQSIKDIPPELR